MGHKARCFLKELARHVSLATEDNQAHSHLIQRLVICQWQSRGEMQQQFLGALGWVWGAAVLGCIGVGMGL